MFLLLQILNLFLPPHIVTSCDSFNNLTKDNPLLGSVSLLRDGNGMQPSQGCFNYMHTVTEEIWLPIVGNVSSYRRIAF